MPAELSLDATEMRDGAEAAALSGLDALEIEQVETTPRWRRTLSAVYPPLIAVLLILAVWEIAYLIDFAPDDKLPSPIESWRSLHDFAQAGQLYPAIGGSLKYGALGFAIAALIGTPLGLLIGRVKLVRAGIGPIVTGLQTLPSVAWVPVAIIWFHLTPGVKFFVVIMGATPSIANGVVNGLDLVPPLFLRVGHVLGARGLTLARHVLLPAVLPAYIGGLRQGWAFAWRSLMAAEIIASSLGAGLGELLANAQDGSNAQGESSIAQGIAVILLILIVGIAVEVIFFRPLERSVLRRRGLADAR
jgi:NitT/TauT family transport system permease protein